MFSPLFGFGFLELLYLGLLGLKLCELRPLVTSTLGYLGLWKLGHFCICFYGDIVLGPFGHTLAFGHLEPFGLCPDSFGFLMVAFSPNSFGLFILDKMLVR